MNTFEGDFLGRIRNKLSKGQCPDFKCIPIGDNVV